MSNGEELADVVLESTPASTAAPADQANVSTAPFTSSQQAPADLEALLSKLMELLLSFPNKSVAIGLALKAASLLGEEQEADATQAGRGLDCMRASSREPLTGGNAVNDGESSPSWEAASAAETDAAACRRSDGTASETRPERRELASMIDDYPSCKRLMEAYRRVYHMPNKTPLSILFEYASRLNLQLSFEEGLTSNGCFTLTLQLKNERDVCLYRPGVGMAKSKKDAKQLAAAALLEVMLEHVPFQDLLYKSDKQQNFKDIQGPRSHLAIPRGRGRPSQRHCGPNLAYRAFPGCPQYAIPGAPATTGLHSGPQGLPGGFGGLQRMSMPGLSTQNQMHQGVPSFDLGHGLGQQHRLLLARAGSDPTTALTHIPGGGAPARLGLSFPEHSSHQELLCNNLDLAGIAQHGAQGHSLPYTQPSFDASLAAGMASLGLQGSYIDNLHSTQWQDPMMQANLMANPMPEESTPLGLPPHQLSTLPQSMAPLPHGAYNIPGWLPDNVMH
ncbi:hypothetical protein CVIRNUC_000126 [Coccomyxa viridis]|uniref:DRBM domain-containing protein n=1 Tax=Coccomyxa viridis TaxID=1274662 RepID=A0AAV1HPP3_9CHLO|nr:hypothetical protein CVIRNUC_000126 [Coccomyxa viridis]